LLINTIELVDQKQFTHVVAFHLIASR